LGFSADSFEPGVGLSKSKVLMPVEITPYLPQNVKIVQVFCGAAFSLLKTQDGELYGCGINDLGQLGLDTYVEDM
jgi:alpha-tubulin suppressor-like RCC1 family protein